MQIYYNNCLTIVSHLHIESNISKDVKLFPKSTALTLITVLITILVRKMARFEMITQRKYFRFTTHKVSKHIGFIIFLLDFNIFCYRGLNTGNVYYTSPISFNFFIIY
jgi:hypothetical protein